VNGLVFKDRDRTSVCSSTCCRDDTCELLATAESDRPAAAAAAAAAQPSESINSASFNRWVEQHHEGVGGAINGCMVVQGVCTFLYSGEIGPLLGRQLHLSPDDLKWDAVAVRRVCRLKHNTKQQRRCHVSQIHFHKLSVVSWHQVVFCFLQASLTDKSDNCWQIFTVVIIDQRLKLTNLYLKELYVSFAVDA